MFSSAKVLDYSFDVSRTERLAQCNFLGLFVLWAVRNAYLWTLAPGNDIFYWMSCAILTVFQLVPSLTYLTQERKLNQKLRAHFNITPSLIESMIVMGTSVGFGIDLIMRASYGQCLKRGFHDVWRCNPTADVNLLPEDSALLVVLSPVILCG
jgi:hypothetical protein